MSLSEADVRHVAKLAALEVSEQDIPALQDQLSGILDFVAKLSSVNSRGVIATSHVHGVVNAFREDLIKDSFPEETALSNAPDYAMGGFRVPRIIF